MSRSAANRLGTSDICAFDIGFDAENEIAISRSVFVSAARGLPVIADLAAAEPAARSKAGWSPWGSVDLAVVGTRYVLKV